MHVASSQWVRTGLCNGTYHPRRVHTYISLIFYHFFNINTLVRSHFKATVEAEFFQSWKYLSVYIHTPTYIHTYIHTYSTYLCSQWSWRLRWWWHRYGRRFPRRSFGGRMLASDGRYLLPHPRRSPAAWCYTFIHTYIHTYIHKSMNIIFLRFFMYVCMNTYIYVCMYGLSCSV